MNIHFSKEDVQIAKKHIKRYLASLVIRKLQIKTMWPTISYPLRMVIINETSVRENVEKLEPAFVAAGNVKWWGHLAKNLTVHQNVKHRVIWSVNFAYSSVYSQEKWKHMSTQRLVHNHISVIQDTKLYKRPKCPSTDKWNVIHLYNGLLPTHKKDWSTVYFVSVTLILALIFLSFSAFEMSSQLQNIKLHSKMAATGAARRSPPIRTDSSGRWQEAGSDWSSG